MEDPYRKQDRSGNESKSQPIEVIELLPPGYILGVHVCSTRCATYTKNYRGLRWDPYETEWVAIPKTECGGKLCFENPGSCRFNKAICDKCGRALEFEGPGKTGLMNDVHSVRFILVASYFADETVIRRFTMNYGSTDNKAPGLRKPETIRTFESARLPKEILEDTKIVHLPWFSLQNTTAAIRGVRHPEGLDPQACLLGIFLGIIEAVQMRSLDWLSPRHF